MAYTRLLKADMEKLLPHRGEALLPDEVWIPQGVTADNPVGPGGVTAIGYMTVKNRHCRGHVAGYPILKGQDRGELAALVIGAAWSYILGLPPGQMVFLTECHIKTSRPAVPGDRLMVEMTVTGFEPNGRAPRMDATGVIKNLATNKSVCQVVSLSGVIGSKIISEAEVQESNAALCEETLALIRDSDDKPATVAELLGLQPADAGILFQTLGLPVS